MPYLLVSTCFGKLSLDCIGHIIFVYEPVFVVHEHSEMNCFVCRPTRQVHVVLIQMNLMNTCCLLVRFFELLGRREIHRASFWD